MPTPALFPMPPDFLRPYDPYAEPVVIRAYKGLDVWVNGHFDCNPRARYRFNPGPCTAFWAVPTHLNTYVAYDDFPDLATIAPAYLLASLWFLGTDNRWHVHRTWTNLEPYGRNRWGSDRIS